jgi:hypothetical protein
MMQYTMLLPFIAIFTALFMIGITRLPLVFTGLVMAAIAIILGVASFIYPPAMPYLGLLIGVPVGYGFSFLMDKLGINNPLKLQSKQTEINKRRRATRRRKKDRKSIYVSEAMGHVTDARIFENFDEFIQSINMAPALNTVLEYIRNISIINNELAQQQVLVYEDGKKQHEFIQLVDADSIDEVSDVIQRAIRDRVMANNKINSILSNRETIREIIGGRFMVIYVDGAPDKIIPLYYNQE